MSVVLELVHNHAAIFVSDKDITVCLPCNIATPAHSSHWQTSPVYTHLVNKAINCCIFYLPQIRPRDILSPTPPPPSACRDVVKWAINKVYKVPWKPPPTQSSTMCWAGERSSDWNKHEPAYQAATLTSGQQKMTERTKRSMLQGIRKQSLTKDR